MKIEIYSYAIEDRRLGTSIYSHPSIEARDLALDEHLKQIASDDGVDLDPNGEPCDWAEQLDIGLTYDSCVMEVPILDAVTNHLQSIVKEIDYSKHYPSNYSVKESVRNHATEALKKLKELTRK